MKTVLFIAYNFPPVGGVGVQRSLKFVKYLPEFGWQPIVITTTPQAYPFHDDSLWADVPAKTPIYRVKTYDPNGLRPQFKRLKLARLLAAMNIILMLPDAALLWPYLARATVRRVIEQHQPCAVYSSSGPLSSHWLGRWIKEEFGLPWLADFRDRWWTEEWPPQPALPGYRAINRRMARHLLAVPDRIVTVSQPLAEDFQHLSGGSQPFVSVIENGFDRDEIIPLPPTHTSQFTITYTGTLNRKRPPDAFIAAIEKLIAEGQIPVEQIRVVFAGKGMEKYVPAQPPFERPGFLDQEALVDLRRQSDLFVLFLHASPKNQGLFSGKLFEYLGSNRPTLMIGHPDNVAAQLVQRVRAGVVTRHNLSEIMAAILNYYQNWQTGEFNYSPNWTIIRQYTRRNLTARLATELDRLAGPRKNA